MQKPYSIDDPLSESVLDAHARFVTATEADHVAAMAFAKSILRATTLDTPATWAESNAAEVTFRRCREAQMFALGMLAETAIVVREQNE